MTRDSGVSPDTSHPEHHGRRLDSWKEIAAYLKRHVTTVRRWEKREGLPVHRHLHAKLGSVYAYARELDAWFDSRRLDQLGFPELPAPPEVPARPGRLPPPPPLAGLPRWPVGLVGRDAELNVLGEAWAAACRGQQQLVFIEGGPGVGKTRLALEFARSVATQATVLVGRCDSEALVPFAPFVAILRWLVRVTPPRTLRGRLGEIDGGIELAQLVPEVTKRLPLAQESTPSSAEGRRYRMFEAFAQLLGATSRSSPLLLLVEDMHWADRGSLLLLRHLVRSACEAALCIIVTCRDTEPGRVPWSGEILEDLRREGSATRMVLGGLSEDSVRLVVEAWMRRDAPPSLTRLVAQSTEGNALFITEMLRHLSETGALARPEILRSNTTVADLGLPEGIRQLIGRRLSRLSEASNRLLTLASVVGREFSLPVVEALADLPEPVVLDAIDEAVAANVIVEDPRAPGRFSFTHSLVRETLYGGLTAARRVRLHHRIGETLERQCAPGRLPLGDLAYHFGQAAVYRDADKAIAYAVRAGDHASAALALEDAARYYDMALRTLDLPSFGPEVDDKRFDLHTRRARSFVQVGEWASAKSAFETALSLLKPPEDVKRCESLVSLAETSFWLMDVEGVRRFAGEAQTLAERVGRDDLWADALAWVASAKVADGDVLGGIAIDRQALTRVGGIRSFALARVPLTLYWAGRTVEAVELAAQAVERARKSEDPAFLLYALQHWGLSLSGAGRYDEALRAFDEAQTFGRRCGALPLLARATSMSVAPLLSLGDLEGATTRALEARELAHRVAFEPPLVSAGIDLLLISARSQDPGRAESWLDEVARAVQQARGWHAWKWSLRLWQARAELALARGDFTDAITAARNVVQQSRSRSRLKYEALGLSVRARAQHRLGVRHAGEDAQAAADLARRLADPAVLLECLAVLLEVDGSDEVLAEARGTVQRILGALSPEPLRRALLATVSPRLVPHSI